MNFTILLHIQQNFGTIIKLTAKTSREIQKPLTGENPSNLKKYDQKKKNKTKKKQQLSNMLIKIHEKIYP